MKKLYLFFYLLIPFFAVAQLKNIPESIVSTDCGGVIFVRVETLPSVRGGENVLSDSLLSYLKQNNVVIKNGKATFSFIITTSSEIFEIVRLSGSISARDVFLNGLQAYSHLWIPAIQNSHNVCDRIRFEVEFASGKISVKIKQGG